MKEIPDYNSLFLIKEEFVVVKSCLCSLLLFHHTGSV